MDCDACHIAEARVAVFRPGQQRRILIFCQHHYNEYAETLHAQGWEPAALGDSDGP